MHGEAYRQSSEIARDHGGAFVEYALNCEPFLRVIEKHRDAAYAIPEEGVPTEMLEAARRTYDETLQLGREHGYRNAQVTVLAPTGTIAFMMDCDTTGVEPDIALIKYKKLVGEGYLKIVNQTVPAALRKLGYSPTEVEEIVAYVNERETIEGAPGLKPEHLPVFDCAFKPVNGERSIHYMGHVRMMGSIQPFLSGAISKTVNMPEAATAEEIETVYLEGWKLGLKAIAIYRDGSKRSQPLSTGKKKDDGVTAEESETIEQLRAQLAAARSRPPSRIAGACRTSGPRSRTGSRSRATRATSRSACTPMGSRARSSSRWPRKARRSAGLMDTLATSVSWRSSTACRSRTWSTSSPTCGSSPPASPATPRSRSRSRSSTTSSGGSGSRFLPTDDKASLGLIDRSAIVDEVLPRPRSRRRALGELDHLAQRASGCGRQRFRLRPKSLGGRLPYARRSTPSRLRR